MTAPKLSLAYDPEADAMYVWLASAGTASARSEALDDGRVVDYDDNQRPVGVEFLSVSRGQRLDSVVRARSGEVATDRSPKGDGIAAPWGGALVLLESFRELFDHVPSRSESPEPDAEGRDRPELGSSGRRLPP